MDAGPNSEGLHQMLFLVVFGRLSEVEKGMWSGSLLVHIHDFCSWYSEEKPTLRVFSSLRTSPGCNWKLLK